ncbi:hypothetical protein BC828DRAFT_409940 [Blastocladiella britannica]|nr:hypothetical protein BC828DRAFT_409940 [Blastocladiella britannica]
MTIQNDYHFVGAHPRSARLFVANRIADARPAVIKVGLSASHEDPVAREGSILKRLHMQKGAAVAPELLVAGTAPLFGSSRSFLVLDATATCLLDCSPAFVRKHLVAICRALLVSLDSIHSQHRLLHRDLNPANILLVNDGGTISVRFCGWECAAALPHIPAADAGSPVHYIDIPSAPKIALQGRMDRVALWSLRAHRTGGVSCPGDDLEMGLLSVAAALQDNGMLPWAVDPTSMPANADVTADLYSTRSPYVLACESRKWQSSLSTLAHVPSWLVNLLTRARALAVGEMADYAALLAVVTE